MPVHNLLIAVVSLVAIASLIACYMGTYNEGHTNTPLWQRPKVYSQLGSAYSCGHSPAPTTTSSFGTGYLNSPPKPASACNGCTQHVGLGPAYGIPLCTNGLCSTAEANGVP